MHIRSGHQQIKIFHSIELEWATILAFSEPEWYTILWIVTEWALLGSVVHCEREDSACAGGTRLRCSAVSPKRYGTPNLVGPAQ